MVGILNPNDSERSTAARPPQVNNDDGERRWFSDELRTRPSAQELNNILALFRNAGDVYGVPDVEGDDDYLVKILDEVGRETLSAERTYYVRTDGNNGNTGLVNSSGGAFLTIGHAIDVAKQLDGNWKTIKIKVEDGTYTENVLVDHVSDASAYLVIEGNHTTPGNCIIATTTGSAVTVKGCSIGLGGFKLQASAGRVGLTVTDKGAVRITGSMAFTGGTNIQMFAHGVITVAQAAAATLTFLGGEIAIRAEAYCVFWAYCNAVFDGAAYTTVFYIFRSIVYFYGGTHTEVGTTGRRYVIISDGTIYYFDVDIIMMPGDTDGSNDAVFSYRNVLHNGDGMLQNGRAWGVSGPFGDDTYSDHNRWYALTQSGNVSALTMTNVATGVPRLMRVTQEHASSQRFGYAQIVEQRHARHLRGKTVTLSAMVRCSNLNMSPRVAILAWTGTGNAVTSDIIADWSSASYALGGLFASSSLALVAVGGIVTPAVNTLYSIRATGVVPDTMANLIAVIVTNTGTAQNTRFDFRAQLEDGGLPSPFEHRAPSIEETMCARFVQAREGYASSFDEDPHFFEFIPEMRAVPTLSLVNVTAGLTVTKHGFQATDGGSGLFQFFATAEL